jgi:hypothetical protein
MPCDRPLRGASGQPVRRCGGDIAMIAKGHFHGPPAIPTLIAKGYPDARPGRQFTRRISFDYHGKNRGGIERSADYPLSAERFHLWSPDLWSRANGLESALTFIERGSEMKALWLWRRNSGPRGRRKPLARDGPRAETRGRKHLAQPKPAPRPRHFDCPGIAGDAESPESTA